MRCAAAIHAGADAWSAFTNKSWNVGLQADVYRQNGGLIPTITIQETLTRSVPDASLATTSFNNVIEADYALNDDETCGMLAAFQYTKVAAGTVLATVNANLIGYVGGYYQWDNNWKLTGRVGVQSFGGARLLNFNPIASFTQPLLRIDLDQLDDSDNHLFGASLQVSWVPKPSYQLTFRTPLYIVRNMTLNSVPSTRL